MEQIPPFYVGQEVEAINDDRCYFKKGDRFIVTNVQNFHCKCANPYAIEIGISEFMEDPVCYDCRMGLPPRNIAFDPKDFRAITPNFESISFTQVVEENLVSVN